MRNTINASSINSNTIEDDMLLLTAEEVAQMLMVGKNRVYELLKQKKLKGMRIGTSSWRIPKAAVYQYIQEESGL